MWPKPIAQTVEKLVKNASAHTDENGDLQDKHYRLPILIFPGLMSSALRVKESNIVTKRSISSSETSWQGKRIWLNIKSAGFGSLYFGSALKAIEEKKELGESYDEEQYLQYQREYQCKNEWLQHLMLATDLKSDPDGIRLQPLEGLDAVDYLVPGGGLAKHVSWVFGPVISMLERHGYTSGVDLDAAPYDWRLPPTMLEQRDEYFSNTKRRIEKMYEQNDNTRVVLLCHSMGCKMCHYFLNWIKANYDGGQEWLDKHIHTYFPVGAPHLGAPETIRSSVAGGSRMGLEAFLSLEEALMLGRTFGSLIWMYPTHLPDKVPAPAILRREGVLHVTVSAFDTEAILQGRSKIPSKLRLSMRFKNNMLRSNFKDPEGDNFRLTFSETFTFAAPPELPQLGSVLQIALHEPGFSVTNKADDYRPFSWASDMFHWMWQCPVLSHLKCILRLPCRAADTTVNTIAAAADATIGAFGSARIVAASDPVDLSTILTGSDPTDVSVRLLHFADYLKTREGLASDNSRSLMVKLRVTWLPPGKDFDHSKFPYVIAAPSKDTPDLQVSNVKDKNAPYESIDGVQLIKCEYLPNQKKLLDEVYEIDPLGPRTTSSADAPPVKNVKAVYGINLPTEVSGVYRRRSMVQQPNRIKSRHELDEDARFLASNEFLMESGTILETPRTPQRVIDKSVKETVVCRSGDGTVPYWSLQHCKTWQGPCNVQVDEIEKAEHREILADERFHKILMDYVVRPKDSSNGSGAVANSN